MEEHLPKHIAIFGGTFDPPTLMHEVIIQACLDRTDMDEVWVMPSGQRLDKPHMLANDIRLSMLSSMACRSFAGNPRLKVSNFEMQLPQPGHTYATVDALRKTYPDNRFWFVFGTDSYLDMPNWEHGAELQRSLGMLLVAREGYVVPELTPNVRELAVPERAVHLNLSSTAVREALREGRPVDSAVSPAVAEYLQSSTYYGVPA